MLAVLEAASRSLAGNGAVTEVAEPIDLAEEAFALDGLLAGGTR